MKHLIHTRGCINAALINAHHIHTIISAELKYTCQLTVKLKKPVPHWYRVILLLFANTKHLPLTALKKT